MKFYQKALAALLAVFMLGGACHGSFSLTGKYDGFIRSIGNKWVRWIVFLISFWVGGLFLVADAILFNSIEFWLGRNVIGKNDFDPNGEHKKVVQKGDETAIFIYRDFGRSLEIQIEKNGVKKQALLHRDQVGVLYNKEDSAWVPYTVREQESVAGVAELQILRAGKVDHTLPASEVARLEEQNRKVLAAIR